MELWKIAWIGVINSAGWKNKTIKLDKWKKIKIVKKHSI